MVYPGDCKQFERLEYEILKAEWIGKNMEHREEQRQDHRGNYI